MPKEILAKKEILDGSKNLPSVNNALSKIKFAIQEINFRLDDITKTLSRYNNLKLLCIKSDLKSLIEIKAIIAGQKFQISQLESKQNYLKALKAKILKSTGKKDVSVTRITIKHYDKLQKLLTK